LVQSLGSDLNADVSTDLGQIVQAEIIFLKKAKSQRLYKGLSIQIGFALHKLCLSGNDFYFFASEFGGLVPDLLYAEFHMPPYHG
jgi:hypothetical protein